MDVVLERPDAAALADFDGHAARHHVARGQILVGGGVALHEPLAFGIGEVAALAACAFGDETAGAVDAGGVKLDELHVFERQALAGDHAAAVACTRVRRSRREIRPAVSARCQHGHLCVEAVQRAVVELPGQHALARAVLGHDEVDGEILDEELRVVFQRLSVERVQDGVAGAVCRGAGALDRRPFAELGGVPAEGALIDTAVLGAREGHAVVLEFIDCLGCLAGEVLHGVGVAEPVGALHRVVHVPLPVVGAHVAKRGCNAALGGYRVRAGGEDLGDAAGAQALLGHSERRPQPGSTRAHDDDVVGVVDEIICGHGSGVLRRRRFWRRRRCRSLRRQGSGACWRAEGRSAAACRGHSPRSPPGCPAAGGEIRPPERGSPPLR